MSSWAAAKTSIASNAPATGSSSGKHLPRGNFDCASGRRWMRRRAALLVRCSWTSRLRRSAGILPTLRNCSTEQITGVRFWMAHAVSTSTGTMGSQSATSTAMASTICTFASLRGFPTGCIATEATGHLRTSLNDLGSGFWRILRARFLRMSITTGGKT